MLFYQGKKKEFSRGKYDWIGNDWNDQVSSLKLSYATGVSYYDDINFGGGYSHQNSSNKWIGTDWNDKISSMIVFDRYQAMQWMSNSIPDNTKLSELSIPGTHDSGTWTISKLYESAKCQSRTLTEQIAMGVRFFDIRCKEKDSYLNVYHGSVSTGIKFKDVLGDLKNFLHDCPRECIIMSLKNEGDDHDGFAGFFP